MKRCFIKAFISIKYLFLFLLPSAVKTEDEYCRPEDRIGTTMPYRLHHEDVCPLMKNVLFQTTFNFLDECAFKCSEDVFCRGYNFKEKEKKKMNCQLTLKVDHDFHSCSEDDKGWNFYHPILPRKVRCDELKFCKNGGKTIIDLKGGPGSDPYRCECPKAFKGDLCEIDTSQFLNSTILSGEPLSFKDQILDWLPVGQIQTTLCWRATTDGWSASTFHSQCDFKAPTLTIVKVGNFIFGGYATASWDRVKDAHKKAPGSFMFSLRNNENLSPFKASLKDQNVIDAIYVYTSYGPTFGGGFDLLIDNNADLTDSSNSNFNFTYRAPSGVSKPRTILAGTHNFTPSEVEVFYLV